MIKLIKYLFGKKPDAVKEEPKVHQDEPPNYDFMALKDKIVGSLKEKADLPQDKNWIIIEGFGAYTLCDKTHAPFWDSDRSVPYVLLACKETGEIKTFALKALLPDLEI